MIHEQPVRRIPSSRKEVVVEIIAAVGILSSVIVIVQAWSALPNPSPIHFGLSGKPNFWFSKGSIIVLPLISFVLNAWLTLSSAHPRRFHYPWPVTEQNLMRQYRIARSLLLWIKVETAWLVAFVVWQIIRVALRETERLNITFFLVILFIVLVTVGFHLYQAYRAR